MLKFVVGALLLFLVWVPAVVVEASPEILLQRREADQLAYRVHYERVRQVTSVGFRDIHVLRAPIDEPSITVGPAESINETGLRETLTTLLRDNGAVAGVNADFFGMANIRTAGFGPTVRDGVLMSVGTGLNREGNEFATLYIEYPHNAFIIYTQTQLDFLNDGERSIEIQSINKITDMVLPIIVNSAAMEDTTIVGERFPGMFKIVVEDGYIVHLSQGYPVDVPEDGFVVLVPASMARYMPYYFSVGQRAEMTIRSGVDFARITQAIGGGGRILLDGQYVEDGLVIGGRHPRTAVGISEDGRYLIMVVVDGRGFSVGATHPEMADIMLAFGAHNAMMLDGGGSSTIAAATPQRPDVSVVNTPSDGGQRRIINALAVFNNSVPGEPVRLEVQSATGDPDSVHALVPNRIEVFTTDINLNRFEVDWEDVDVIAVNDPDGRWYGSYFTASRPGPIIFEATHLHLPGMYARRELRSTTLMQLVPDVPYLSLDPGQSRALSFSGIDHLGSRSEGLNGLSFVVSDPALGHVQGTQFVAGEEAGVGYIQAWVGSVVAHLPVAVGMEEAYFGGLSIPPDSEFSDIMRQSLPVPAPYGSWDIVAVPYGQDAPQGDLSLSIAPLNEYSIRIHENVAILEMSIAEGGLFSTNRQQWANFSRDIAETGAHHVVVVLDQNPLATMPGGELGFFIEVLGEFVEEMGMNVVVLSAHGAQQTTTRDGIRFINLANLYENTSSVRIRISGLDMQYDID